MKTLAAAILVSIFCSAALAKPATVFVGGSGTFGMIAEQTHYKTANGGEVWRIDGYNIAPGAQLSAGLTCGRWSAYGGFQTSSFATNTDISFEDIWVPPNYHTTRHWRQSDRVIIGGRLSGSDSNRARALIGIGFSWGWIRRSKSVEHSEFHGGELVTVEETVHQVSKGSFGVSGELGGLFPVYRDLDLSVIGRLDVINSQLGYDETRWLHAIDALYLANIQIGLQYHFPRSGGK